MRKLWNPRNFKAHVSPHEMLQAVVLCSKKRFQFTDQGEMGIGEIIGDMEGDWWVIDRKLGKRCETDVIMVAEEFMRNQTLNGELLGQPGKMRRSDTEDFQGTVGESNKRKY